MQPRTEVVFVAHRQGWCFYLRFFFRLFFSFQAGQLQINLTLSSILYAKRHYNEAAGWLLSMPFAGGASFFFSRNFFPDTELHQNVVSRRDVGQFFSRWQLQKYKKNVSLMRFVWKCMFLAAYHSNKTEKWTRLGHAAGIKCRKSKYWNIKNALYLILIPANQQLICPFSIQPVAGMHPMNPYRIF